MIKFTDFCKHQLVNESAKQSYKIMMKRATPFFRNTESLNIESPPKTNSETTKTELGEVFDAMIMSEEKLKYEKDLDKNYMNMMANIIDASDEERDLIRELKRQIDTLTLKQKFKYNRPRPREVAKMYDKKLNPHVSVDTPGYPSNHTVTGLVIAEVLSRRHPEHKTELMKIANDNAESRVSLGVHFVSDVEAGREFAKQMLERYKEESHENI